MLRLGEVFSVYFCYFQNKFIYYKFANYYSVIVRFRSCLYCQVMATTHYPMDDIMTKSITQLYVFIVSKIRFQMLIKDFTFRSLLNSSNDSFSFWLTLTLSITCCLNSLEE